MNCKTCGIPEGNGYILPADHYEKDNMRTSVDGKRINYNEDMYGPFTVHSLSDNKIYLDSGIAIDTLENTGVDLCDNIDMAHPLSDVKLNNGECAWCIADKIQLKLF